MSGSEGELQMSKFEEMCRALGKARHEYFEYQNACFVFGAALERRFIEYCRIPEGHLRLIPLNQAPKEGTLYAPAGAMHLDDDTFWHLGMHLTLYTAPNQVPWQPVRIAFCIKHDGGDFLVRFGTDPRERLFRVNPKSGNGFEELFEYAVGKVNAFLTRQLQWFLSDSAVVQKIGFV